MDRVILHCDCNSFFASVETVLNPELCAGPMAVCGDPNSRHGIILAKNEQAKRFGVKTAETIWQAQRKCPGLMLVRPHRNEYVKYSRLVNEIYRRYTDQVEPFGIDESWLDVTGSQNLFGAGREIANRLRHEVRQETGLTISVGVSFNKIFAKMGSDYKKPDATTVIDRRNWQQMIWPLPVSSLLYVGASVEKTLSDIYIQTIGQLAAADPAQLTTRLGKLGGQIYDYANGMDDSVVQRSDTPREIKSVGNGMTFRRDLTDIKDIRVGVAALSDEVATRMRRYGLCCRTVQLQIKDTYMRTTSRQCPLQNPTGLSSELAEAAMKLVAGAWNGQTPIRMLTVTGINLVDAAEAAEQLSFFGTPPQQRERRKRLETAIDSVREKFGRDSISTGAVMISDIGLEHESHEDD
ncbi:DNA polymerase IV [Oscillospiraceae bacterium LTW-04]|nr:DNA polymerase IV [Oscillospiraceae bacterium MB24-C1]